MVGLWALPPMRKQLGVGMHIFGLFGTPCLPAPAPRAPHAQGDNCALHWAAMRGHVEIVKFLLLSGADRALRNKQDKVGHAGIELKKHLGSE